MAAQIEQVTVSKERIKKLWSFTKLGKSQGELVEWGVSQFCTTIINYRVGGAFCESSIKIS